VVGQDTLNPINHSLELFNKSKENRIYKPLKTSPKSSMCDKCKREKKEERLESLVAITITLTVPH